VTAPRLVLRPAAAAEQVGRIRAGLPGFDILYAVKSLAHPAILTALAPVATGFEVASLREVRDVLGLGIAPERLLFGNPVKPAEDIARVHELGVRRFVFQSAGEVDKLARHAPGADVLVRFAPAAAVGPADTAQFARKFGCDAEQVVPLLRRAAEAGLGARGICFHVGTQVPTPDPWCAGLVDAGRLVAQARAAGLPVDLVDIGGGFPVDEQTHPGASAEVFAGIADAARRHLPPDVRLSAQPGRFVASPAGDLHTSVISREERGGSSWLFLDCGVFHGLLEVLEFAKLPFRAELTRSSTAQAVEFVLAGPSCDGFDVVPGTVRLPGDAAEGDVIVFRQAGAYVDGYASRFNGIDPPQIVLD
jgi:ornithine decarboxylase